MRPTARLEIDTMNTTAVEKKITKVIAFTAIHELLSANFGEDEVIKTITVGSGEKAQQVDVTVGIVMEKLSTEIAQLAKKNSADKALTEKQKANNAIKTAILGSIDPERKYTISDMIKHIDACKELTNQKVSAIVRQMVNEDGTMVRATEDGKAVFSLNVGKDEDEE